MRPRVGVSECLLGKQVRHDGGHKRNDVVCEALARDVELVPVCPEVEVGMGVPREPLRLVGAAERPRLIAQGGVDHTQAMEAWAAARVAALAASGLDGYVLKSRSPSCGLGGVPVEGTDAAATGLFAAALVRQLPELPIIEESALADDAQREAFLARVRAHARARP